jgi:hypothetical protein
VTGSKSGRLNILTARMLRPGYAALPVYVNFKASLKLEPLYRVNANAVYWFNQWLLAIETAQNHLVSSL